MNSVPAPNEFVAGDQKGYVDYMRNTTKLALALCAAITLSACASNGPDRRDRPDRGDRGGQRGGEGAQRTAYEGYAAKPIAILLSSMDADGDHRIEITEFEAGVEKEWTAFTADGQTGALSYAKWAKQVLGAADALPSYITFDRNLDGTISELEFTDYLSKQFVSLDANSDDVLETSELVFRIEQQRVRGGDQAGQGRGQRGGGGGGRGEGGGGNRPPR